MTRNEIQQNFAIGFVIYNPDVEFLNKLREQHKRENQPQTNKETPKVLRKPIPLPINTFSASLPKPQPFFNYQPEPERENPFNFPTDITNNEEPVKYIRPMNTFPKCYRKSPV